MASKKRSRTRCPVFCPRVTKWALQWRDFAGNAWTSEGLHLRTRPRYVSLATVRHDTGTTHSRPSCRRGLTSLYNLWTSWDKSMVRFIPAWRMRPRK